MVAVGALLGLAAAAAALSQPQLSRVPPPEQGLPRGRGHSDPPVSQPPVTEEGVPPPPAELPGWLSTLLVYLCLAVVVVIAAVVVWVVLRDTVKVRRGALPVDPGAPTPLAPRSTDVIAAVDAGLDALSDTDRDPRRAVIACWVRLEHAAAAAGTPRQVGDTPTELVWRLLCAHRVDRRVLDAFAGIYRAARYATHDVDEGMRVQAVSALRQLRAELTAPLAGAP